MSKEPDLPLPIIRTDFRVVHPLELISFALGWVLVAAGVALLCTGSVISGIAVTLVGIFLISVAFMLVSWRVISLCIGLTQLQVVVDRLRKLLERVIRE